MTDEPTTSSATDPVCPWCSAALPDAGAVTCPSCGAALTTSVDESLPGLTAIDAGAIIRGRQSTVRPKSRLLSWLSGEDPDDVFTKAEGNALEPPELEVRREMFRMELEAEVANLQAENDAILAEAVADGRVVELPPELAGVAEDLVPTALAGAIATSGEAVEPEATADVTVDQGPVADAPPETEAAADGAPEPVDPTAPTSTT